jgi:hypothetical protein
MEQGIHTDSALHYDSSRRMKTAGRHRMARREPSLSCKLACVIGMRHTLMLPGIDADMREFGEEGIRKHERALQAANADEIDTLLTMLKLRDDWQGREMAWHLQWLLLKAETPERRRRSPDGILLAGVASY